MNGRPNTRLHPTAATVKLWAILIFGALELGCAQRAPVPRAHEVLDPLGQPLTEGTAQYGDTFDWQNQGPLQFLEQLKATRGYTVQGRHRGWLKAGDISDLVGLLDSKQPCGWVAMSISSYREPGLSTVGQEAAFLIKGFRAGEYPPSLNSTRPVVDRAELRLWLDSLKTREHGT